MRFLFSQKRWSSGENVKIQKRVQKIKTIERRLLVRNKKYSYTPRVTSPQKPVALNNITCIIMMVALNNITTIYVDNVLERALKAVFRHTQFIISKTSQRIVHMDCIVTNIEANVCAEQGAYC